MSRDQRYHYIDRERMHDLLRYTTRAAVQRFLLWMGVVFPLFGRKVGNLPEPDIISLCNECYSVVERKKLARKITDWGDGKYLHGVCDLQVKSNDEGKSYFELTVIRQDGTNRITVLSGVKEKLLAHDISHLFLVEPAPFEVLAKIISQDYRGDHEKEVGALIFLRSPGASRRALPLALRGALYVGGIVVLVLLLLYLNYKV